MGELPYDENPRFSDEDDPEFRGQVFENLKYL